MPRSLDFAPGTPEALANAAMRLLSDGGVHVRIRPWNTLGQAVATELRRRAPAITFVPDAPYPADKDDWPWAIPDAKVDLTILAEESGGALSTLLLEHLDVDNAHILAPITERHFQNLPLFLISMPKAGTHLLQELINAFGYAPGHAHVFPPRPGVWYYTEHATSHTEARDFLNHRTFRDPFHPFLWTPALFIYRNPLDILVSEANYYRRPGKTAFAAAWADLTAEECLDRLIDDPWLLGSIRERVGRYAAWLEMPNVIPVSFEELVGPKGGGDAALQEDLIWSLQLKLQVPGSPALFGRKIFNPAAPTFHQGQIGRYREDLSTEQLTRISHFPQDFMETFGFRGTSLSQAVFPPQRADEFRHRPLQLAPGAIDNLPITISTSFFGYNIIRFRGRFYAVPQALGNIIVKDLSDAQLAQLPHAEIQSELEMRLVFGQDQVARAKLQAARETPATFRAASCGSSTMPQEDPGCTWNLESRAGFSIIRQHGFFFVVRQALGPVDLSLPFETLHSMYSSQDLLWLPTVEQARMAIDLLASQEVIAALRQELQEAIAALRQELQEARRAISEELRTALEALRSEEHSGLHSIRDDVRNDQEAMKSEVRDGLKAVREDTQIHLQAVRNELSNAKQTTQMALQHIQDNLDEASYSRVFQVIRKLGALRRRRMLKDMDRPSRG